MKTKPFKYQREGAAAIERFNGRALVADEMGLGKTFQALLWARRNPSVRPIIIVCEATLKVHWSREALRHVNIRSEILSGLKPAKMGFSTPHQIIIVNYDILHKWVHWLRRLKAKLVIVDECQKIGNRSTRRSKAVKRLCKGVKHIICLSGTPLTNRPAELWPTLNIINPKVFSSFREYADRYCDPKLRRWGWDYSGAANLGELHKQLKVSCMIRRLKEDVLDELPPLRRIVVPTEIEDRKQYEKAVKDFIGWLRSYSHQKSRRAAKVEQMAKMGYLKRLVGRLKLKFVIEWIDRFLVESDGKLIVFGVHKKVLIPLHKHYKHNSVLVNGEVIGKERQGRIDQFTHQKKTRLFFGNIRAAGTGWNGSCAEAVAFVELAWTPAEHSQAEARPHRIGQKGSVTCYYLTAISTIEERLLQIIQKKQQRLDATLNGRKQRDSFDVYDLLADHLMKGKK